MKHVNFVAHPWHGVNIGNDAPDVVTAFIEIVPTDTVKYEIDKASGYLKVDRPQKFSNIVPTLYGFIPQTFCDKLTAEFCAQKSGLPVLKGDGDPLDICIFSEHIIPHGNILVQAKPIGGFRLIDNGEADDKIIAVMSTDEMYKSWNDINDVPEHLIKKLKHYFLTYKNFPGTIAKCEINQVYGRMEALEVIKASCKDYKNCFLSL